MASMHAWDAKTELFAHSVIGYAIERLRIPKDPRWGSHPRSELDAALAHAITPDGAGGHEAMRLVREVLMPACRPMDDPMNLAYVPTAPTVAATMFDLVVSASSIFGGAWEGGAGAIAAENQALRWLAGLAGLPDTAGGVFLSGGSAVNLSALVTARSAYRERHPHAGPLAFAATTEVHASVRATARVMDVDVVTVEVDENDRMTAAALRHALESRDDVSVFAVVASAGTTNSGAIDLIDEVADVCAEHDLWLHVDGAYGLAAMCSPQGRARMAGIERVDSFGVDPHKWLFAPYDCAALVYRDPAPAARAHAQHGDYLDAVDRQEWNPTDYAYHLSRRVRGLPLWFSLATYGTDAYAEAMDITLDTARGFADAVAARPDFDLLLEPELSIVLFRPHDWAPERYRRWSAQRAHEGVALIVPTSWRGEICWRICIVNPHTTIDALLALLDDMATFE
ncbi:MAG: aminotransferase class V-fold PLP-dependent enzyme [Actinomycetota bacterium]